MSLPTDAAARKRLQLYTFMFTYFPDAWLAVVDVARSGNDQHNPGEPLHWARGKSTDQMNAAFNHVFDYGLGEQCDTDGCYHLAKAIWRLSAQLQLDIEAKLQGGKEIAIEHPQRGFNILSITEVGTAIASDLCAECHGRIPFHLTACRLGGLPGHPGHASLDSDFTGAH